MSIQRGTTDGMSGWVYMGPAPDSCHCRMYMVEMWNYSGIDNGMDVMLHWDHGKTMNLGHVCLA